MGIARYWRRSGGLIAGISFLATLLLASCGGGGSSGGEVPTAAVQITGTAAKGAAIASASVTIKDKNGKTATGTTGADGKYTFDVSGMTAPFLLRVSNGNGYLYSVATAEGTTNIHPYTDLIVKNWFTVQGSNVETEFAGTSALAHVPTATEINTIEAVISSILSANMTNAGVASGFNLLTSDFSANSTGFDLVLDNTQVSIDTNGGVTVTATDAVTGITGTVVSTITPIATTADTTNPTNPTGLAALPASTTSIVLTWSASTDNVGVAGYNIYRASNKVATSPYPVYTDIGRTSGTQYCYQVEAFDGAGNVSANMSSQSCATPPAAADNTAPTTPTGLSATAVSASQINLSWSASTDAVGVMGYAVYRGASKVATVTGTSFSDIGLAAGTAYSYTVRAVDGAMNYSAASSSASATTSAGIPASPTNPTASGADGQTTVTWTAVSGATSYNLYWSTTTGVTKSSNKISGATSPYTHAGRTNGTTYYYVVTAVNASGESVESAQVSATPGSASTAVGPNSASGTYTWDAGTGTLTMNFTTSNFVCNGPQVGAASTFTPGITISSTTMTWLPPDTSTWTRSVSGAANDIVGEWTAPMNNGLPFALIFNANGTVAASGTDECAQAFAHTFASGYYIDFQYQDPAATAVSVTGPGISGSQSLSNALGYAPWAFNLSLGVANPTGLPYSYTFTITDASGTKTKTATVSCFQQQFVTNLAPAGTATGLPTFSWTGIADAGASYGVELHNPAGGNNLWSVYGMAGTSIDYAGPALTAGTTYYYDVQVSGSSACAGGSSFVSGSFTYQ